MKMIAVVGVLLLAVICSAGCTLTITTPDPMQFDDLKSTFVSNADGTGAVGQSHVIGVKVVQGAPGSLLVTITGGDATDLTKISVYQGSTLRGSVTPAGGIVTGKAYSFPVTAGNGQTISVVGKFSFDEQTIYAGTMNLI